MIWTAADQAELDVLLHELTTGYAEHREKCDACQPCGDYAAWKEHETACRACQGDAPLTFGPPCYRRDQWLEHNRRGCARCLPCPSLQAAVRVVVGWREARMLLSNAEALRAQECAA